ncbi:uncharacterized protein EV154DRAFT_509948 [Mucor mucedo]|uniref:uncharacterized protein n=1 Tax=Mucor mucedo TaxID=29922 RepID=UPI002220548E|nr:uncharacterized protein EV154DRAFT_509948 [Mucor mucedo]KAI7890905.1 hypothetical protein EV154DRAFT_509948 [Mucor mucedo]
MSSSNSDKRFMAAFMGETGDDVEKWLDEFHCLSQTSGWEENRKYDMLAFHLGGKAKTWFEDNKDTLINCELLESGVIKKYKTNDKEDSAKLTNPAYLSQESSSVHSKKPMFATLPVAMVYKIKEAPPQAEISDAFFKLCVVAACTKRDVLMAYKSEKVGKNEILDDYLNKNFSRHGVINFNIMNLIGNILLCYLPDSYCDFISAYREKLKAGSIFDSDIEHSDLSDQQKTILQDKLRVFNMDNSKICGYVMNNFRIRCEKNIYLPNIDFLNWKTTCLTAEEKHILDDY